MSNPESPILIIGSKKKFISRISEVVPKENKIYTAATNKAVNDFLSSIHPSVILLHLNIKQSTRKEKDGPLWLEILNNIEMSTSYSKVIVVSDTYNHSEALKAIQFGAYDYCINIEDLEIMIRRADQIYRLEEENRQIYKPDDDEGHFYNIVGRCEKIKKIYSIIRRVADSDSTVFISGKSGTGKELVAQAIHKYSKRREHSFVPINCGAIPETLLESELFGHEKGSFTGAESQHIGKLETADCGTIFLDEIGELPILLQVKLLRFLEDKKIERVGGVETISINTRIIAATNKDIKEEVKQERFREDLFFRLSVIPISLPPLKDRGEDILILANYFLLRHRKESNHKIIGFNKKLITWLLQYEWPGNIRELENRIRRGIIMSSKKYLSLDDLGFDEEEPVQGITLQEARMNTDKKLISSYLFRNHGHISRTAQELQISRPTFHNMLKKLNINPKEYKR